MSLIVIPAGRAFKPGQHVQTTCSINRCVPRGACGTVVRARDCGSAVVFFPTDQLASHLASDPEIVEHGGLTLFLTYLEVRHS